MRIAPSPRVLPDFGGSETLSPDFSQVAWIKALNPNDSPPLPATRDRSNELWVTLVSGGTGVRVAPKSATSNEHYIDPVWSPDGRRIAFAGVTEVAALPTSYEYRSAIYVVDADGSDLRLITARPGVGGTGSWSPDGRYLVYPGSPDGTALPAFSNGADVYAGLNPPADIFVIGSDGAGDRNLTNTPWDESGAEWSPDGSRLAYGGARVEGGAAVEGGDPRNGGRSPCRPAHLGSRDEHLPMVPGWHQIALDPRARAGLRRLEVRGGSNVEVGRIHRLRGLAAAPTMRDAMRRSRRRRSRTPAGRMLRRLDRRDASPVAVGLPAGGFGRSSDSVGVGPTRLRPFHPPRSPSGTASRGSSTSGATTTGAVSP